MNSFLSASPEIARHIIPRRIESIVHVFCKDHWKIEPASHGVICNDLLPDGILLFLSRHSDVLTTVHVRVRVVTGKVHWLLWCSCELEHVHGETWAKHLYKDIMNFIIWGILDLNA